MAGLFIVQLDSAGMSNLVDHVFQTHSQGKTYHELLLTASRSNVTLNTHSRFEKMVQHDRFTLNANFCVAGFVIAEDLGVSIFHYSRGNRVPTSQLNGNNAVPIYGRYSAAFPESMREHSYLQTQLLGLEPVQIPLGVEQFGVIIPANSSNVYFGHY